MIILDDKKLISHGDKLIHNGTHPKINRGTLITFVKWTNDGDIFCVEYDFVISRFDVDIYNIESVNKHIEWDVERIKDNYCKI